MKNTLSFDAGERRSFSEFAERANAQKAFMDMDEAIFMGDREIGRRNAEELAYRAKKAIIHDDESLTCGYKCKIYGLTKKREIEIRYESMKNEKARLDLLWELGFMGISFNINRLENSLIMMWSLLFSRGENIFI
jgi:hypothetical protein